MRLKNKNEVFSVEKNYEGPKNENEEQKTNVNFSSKKKPKIPLVTLSLLFNLRIRNRG
jgi:hypothetical protein